MASHDLLMLSWSYGVLQDTWYHIAGSSGPWERTQLLFAILIAMISFQSSNVCVPPDTSTETYHN